MHMCKDCAHLKVCKYTDAGDGRCQKPKHFLDKHQLPVTTNISSNTRKALERVGRIAHGG